MQTEKEQLTGKKLAIIGCLVALDVAATRVLGITVGTFRFSLGSVFIILAAMWYGPLEGALVGGMADVLGCMISGSGFFLPLLISPVLSGALLGILRNVMLKKKNYFRVLLVVSICNAITMLLVTSAGLSVLYRITWLSVAISRIPQYIVTTFICSFIAYRLYYSEVTITVKEQLLV